MGRLRPVELNHRENRGAHRGRWESAPSTPRPRPAAAFSLRVTEFVPPRRMVWTGGMPLGLFTGTRRLHTEPGIGRRGRIHHARGIQRSARPVDHAIDPRPAAFVRHLRRRSQTPCGERHIGYRELGVTDAGEYTLTEWKKFAAGTCFLRLLATKSKCGVMS